VDESLRPISGYALQSAWSHAPLPRHAVSLVAPECVLTRAIAGRWTRKPCRAQGAHSSLSRKPAATIPSHRLPSMRSSCRNQLGRF